MDRTEEALSLLDGILDVERHALREGNFADLAALLAEKSRLVTVLESAHGKADPTLLQRMRQKADANQRLLASAIKGVRAAQRRLEEIRHAHNSLSSYDSQGRARTIRQPRGSIEKRA